MRKLLVVVLALAVLLGACVSAGAAGMSIEERWALQDQWRAWVTEVKTWSRGEPDAEDLEAVAGRRLTRDDWRAVLLISSLEYDEALAIVALESLVVPGMSFDEWYELCLVVGYSGFEDVNGYLLGGMLASAKTVKEHLDIYAYARGIESPWAAIAMEGAQDAADTSRDFRDWMRICEVAMEEDDLTAELRALSEMYNLAMAEPAEWKWQSVYDWSPKGSPIWEAAEAALAEMAAK